MAERLIKCPSCGTTNRASCLSSPDETDRLRQMQDAAARTRRPRPGDRPHVLGSEVEQSATPVLLDLWADWCGPCHMLAPTIDQLSSEMAGRVKVAKLNIDENPATANRFGVRSIPTLLVLKGGTVVDRLVGVQPKQEIVRRLEKALASG